MEETFRKPDFLIIGAQKSATTWLWDVLDSHPGTDLPGKKEIHFFGGVENYKKGKEWYYNHFKNLDQTKLTGEASTSYLYDHIPYWNNSSNLIEVSHSLPTIPELITNEIPNVKIIVILRDPVSRAISAYKHNMRKANRNNIAVKVGLKNFATHYPKFRTLEYGYYARYLRLWMQFIPPEKMLILTYEKDIAEAKMHTISKVYEFLGLDKNFKPPEADTVPNKSWSWTRILFNYYTKPVFGKFIRSKYGKVLDKYDLLASFAISKKDIEFLRAAYLPEHIELEEILGRKLTNWKYGH
ncbi:MAG: hypothetical protein HKN83_09890 [Gammaproteobacteria bacterium]|nr:hypothetical protein [Gammaproteobacteria bacterium]